MRAAVIRKLLVLKFRTPTR